MQRKDRSALFKAHSRKAVSKTLYFYVLINTLFQWSRSGDNWTEWLALPQSGIIICVGPSLVCVALSCSGHRHADYWCVNTNIYFQVRLSHDISDACSQVVEFIDWYETPNHLWVVEELCTGGPLDVVLTQDGGLPESAVASFAFDIACGLHFLHSRGIVHVALHPEKVRACSIPVLCSAFVVL